MWSGGAKMHQSYVRPDQIARLLAGLVVVLLAVRLVALLFVRGLKDVGDGRAPAVALLVAKHADHGPRSRC